MTSFTRRAWIALWLAGALAMPGCALGPRMVDHAFGFDARMDSPGVEILAFRYGAGDYLATHGEVTAQYGLPRQGANINGPMRLGDTLHVRWRLKATGQQFEETVDLKAVLQREMKRQHIRFVAQDWTLFVYLIDPVPRPADWPVIGPRKYQYEQVTKIHPAPPPTPPRR